MAHPSHLVVLALLLAGCPTTTKQDRPNEPVPCAAFGQTCEVSPGKLGTCVTRDDCGEAGACYVCQSQH